MLAEQYAGDAEAFNLVVTQPTLANTIAPHETPTEEPSPDTYLKPHELHALRLLNAPDLTDALHVLIEEAGEQRGVAGGRHPSDHLTERPTDCRPGQHGGFP